MLESFSLNRYYSEKLIFMFIDFPILGEIIQRSPPQIKQIFEYCKFFRFLPREEIIGKGRYNPWIYFVLKGECLAANKSSEIGPFDEFIKTGQMFGVLDSVLDMVGEDRVIADPYSEEITLLGIDTSVFTVQSRIRALDNTTRLIFFETLFNALQKLYWPIQQRLEEYLEATKIKKNVKRELRENEKEEQAEDCFLPSVFKGEKGSTEHLIFYDIECKKLGLFLKEAKRKLTDIAQNKTQDYLSLKSEFSGNKSYLANNKLDHNALSILLSELPFKLKPTVSEFSQDIHEDLSPVLSKTKNKTSSSIKNLRFLVVDDDEEQRNTAVIILHNLGAKEIHVERDGSDAWEYICTHSAKVDVILSDWVMPEMDGIELYNHIQQASDHFKDIVFIMLTSIESRTSVIDAVECGVHGYVIKPLTSNNVLKQIVQAFKHVRGITLKF